MKLETATAINEMLYLIRKHRRILEHNHGKEAVIVFDKFLKEHFINKP